MTTNVQCKKILLEFYRNWLDHLRIFPKESCYADVGLCRGLRIFVAENYYNDLYPVYGMQLARFDAAGLSHTFPFNTAGSFTTECEERRCMFNAKRIYWVRDQIALLEEEIDFFYNEEE